ncbi:coenzyme PQQ synthesis protein D (PqqD) [Allofrancisella inopinata]|uniref:Lasso peptide biosynthesis PqqD family chaperone n=1 Tax=Allofrancisella inopinata TaxID=1085647 RepID=A0AAE6YIZ4_9GAMM|nr:lasso peptide biosynthesis PqqD family chaperone [Allofrancisella inopinata]QIV95584.1 lasso peptide biosynthesis PqqD family chaperone [Allofrancisella inopinata]TDT70727.1 coenzyme PQQ synthesis protein D (PqqD) [Allofrancisella inopinata]
MNNLSIKDKIYRNKDFYSSEIDDEVIMMNIDNNSYYSTGEIGNRIWQLLDTVTTCEDICKQLIQEYDVSQEQCQKDVLKFLTELLDNSAIFIEK